MARVDRPERRSGRALNRADTIFALSSGAPPAAIAIVRISGPDAFAAAQTMAGSLPPARTAALRRLRDGAGKLLDHALVLAFPADASATGEDVVELHCHGGRAVVAAIDSALNADPALRRAAAGEFTRRALFNGRIDLAQAEALGDLLRAETERERVAALAGVEGETSRRIADWLTRLTALSAQVEAIIDYDEDGDVAGHAASITQIGETIAVLRDEMTVATETPTVERLRDGIRVVLAGPRNAGKSTLFNLLAGRDAAIVSPIAGTTRDIIEAPVQRNGTGYLLIDTAGLTDSTQDPVEALGIVRAERSAAAADVILWLGDEPPSDPKAIWIWARSDLPERGDVPPGATAARHDDPSMADALWSRLAERCEISGAMPALFINQRQLDAIMTALSDLMVSSDPLELAESLRLSRAALSDICNASAIDAVLDQLFRNFCVGK